MSDVNFAKIDFTKDECDAMGELVEFFHSQRGAYVAMKRRTAGNMTNMEVDRLAASLNRVKMKVSVASSMIKPNILLS